MLSVWKEKRPSGEKKKKNIRLKQGIGSQEGQPKDWWHRGGKVQKVRGRGEVVPREHEETDTTKKEKKVGGRTTIPGGGQVKKSIIIMIKEGGGWKKRKAGKVGGGS